jgi:hypothetical protein
VRKALALPLLIGVATAREEQFDGLLKLVAGSLRCEASLVRSAVDGSRCLTAEA